MAEEDEEEQRKKRHENLPYQMKELKGEKARDRGERERTSEKCRRNNFFEAGWQIHREYYAQSKVCFW